MKCLLLSLIFAAVFPAQAAAPEVEITAEPHHHLVFENKSVRVYSVTVPPKSATLMHVHRHDYVAVFLGASEISNNVKDKPAVTVKFQDGEVRFTSATLAHIARNLGDQDFRNVTVEFMEDAALRNSTAKWDEDRGLDVLSNGTRQVLFVKDGVRATEIELQPGGVVPMQHAGQHLLIAVSDLSLKETTLTNDVKGIALMPKEAAINMKSGESQWKPRVYLHALANKSDKPAKFVTFEFPESN